MGLTNPVIDTTELASVSRLATLPNGKHYFWRVHAIDAYQNQGIGSSVLRFTAKAWALISAGKSHAMAIKPDGTIWSWGDNEKGQLGIKGVPNSVTPSQIGTDNDWTAVAASDDYSLAMKSKGRIMEWGGIDEFRGGTDKTIPTEVDPHSDDIGCMSQQGQLIWR